MNTIDSAVNSKSQDFIDNAKVMQGLVADLQSQVARVMQGGGERYQQRHQARGKLLVRDRICFRGCLHFRKLPLNLSRISASHSLATIRFKTRAENATDYVCKTVFGIKLITNRINNEPN